MAIDRRLEAPPDGYDRAHWWAPLNRAAMAVWGTWRGQYFEPRDFDLVGRVRRAGRPTIYAYGHRYTGGILYLDHHVRAYRYLAPPDGAGEGRRSGQFRVAESLSTAVGRLGLWQLAHLKPSLWERFPYDDDEEEGEDADVGLRRPGAWFT